MKGARSPRNIESPLDEIEWRALHRIKELLSAFLRDTVFVHGSEAARANLAREVAKSE